MTAATHIAIRDLTMAYGKLVIQRDLSFDIYRGDIFVIMGGSGCGKSTLLKHMLGLIRPASRAAQRCSAATVIGRGGTAVAYLSTDGLWCEKAQLKPVDIEGNEIEPVALAP